VAWIRLDENFPDHPKAIAVGGDACWLHVCALAYCNRNRTDGLVPTGAVPRLSDRRRPEDLVERLLEAVMWHGAGEVCESDDCPAFAGVPDGSFAIHDFLEYQQTRAELDEKHAQKVAAGRAGGHAKARQSAKRNGSKGLADG